MTIVPYTAEYEADLMNMLVEDEEDWEWCYGEQYRENYSKMLRNSITLLAIEDNELAGFIRCRKDGACDLYIHDVFVRDKFRGNKFGQKFMEYILKTYPDTVVFAFGKRDDEAALCPDEYYERLGIGPTGYLFQLR